MPNQEFYPFPPASHVQWLEQVRKDLKGKTDESALKSLLWDEIELEPIYSAEQLKKESIPFSFNPPANYQGGSIRIWSTIFRPSMGDEKTINTEILAALQLGAEGVVLPVTGQEDLNLIFKDVLPQYIQIYFLPKADLPPVLTQVKAWIQSLELTGEMLHGGILWSPTGALFKGKSSFDVAIENANRILDEFNAFPNFYPITIDFAQYANSGATGIQELTFGLGELIELLDHMGKTGISVNQVMAQVAFHTAIGENHFPEIAKLKALRSILVDLAANLGGEISQESIHLIASTSKWNKSILDQDTSLVRQTYEAMAGILGGANAIWVRTIDEKNPSSLTKRIARNVSTILREETSLDKVMDPAAGSYFLEGLQNELVLKVLYHLEELEKTGGWKVNFLTGTIQSQLNATASKAQESVLKKEKTLVGVNKYDMLKASNLTNEQFANHELDNSRLSFLVELEKLKKA